jgi:hypothetical protein
LKEIVNIQINKVVASVSSKGISLFASDAALEVILSESYNPVSTFVYNNSTLISRVPRVIYFVKACIFNETLNNASIYLW